MEETIIQQLEGVFRRVFNEETIVVTKDLKADDIDLWDSLTHMELIAEIEAEVGFEFSYDQVSSFQNVGDMIDLLVARSNS